MKENTSTHYGLVLFHFKMNDNDICEIVDQSIFNFAWKGLRKLYDEEKVFDIVLLAKNGQVSAHKVILACYSTYFK